MAKVTLYEDTAGSLYIHKMGDEIVYGHIEVMIPYGATFEQDASNIADGTQATETAAERIPYPEVATRVETGEFRPRAIWEDGQIHRLSHPGRDGVQYLQSPHDINPAFDNTDRAGL